MFIIIIIIKSIKKSNEIYLKKNGFLLRYMARASTTTPKRFKRRHHQRRRLLSMRVRYCYQRVMIIIIVYERNTMEAHCKLCRCSIRPRERDSNVAWCTMVQCGDNKNAITVDSCIIEQSVTNTNKNRIFMEMYQLVHSFTFIYTSCH